MLRAWSPRARWLGVGVIAVALTGAAFIVNDGLQTRDATLTSFQRAGDGRAIVVTVRVGVGEDIISSHAVEEAASVRVTVRVRRSSGSVPAVALLYPMTVQLRTPLGDRTVVDAAGNPVPDLGDYAPPRPTPAP